MALELGSGGAQSGGASDFCNSFGQGPAAAQGNAVLVQKFVVQPENDAGFQLFQAFGLVLKGCWQVGDGAGRRHTGPGFELALELPETVVPRCQKGFQCARGFIELVPALARQSDVEKAGGG